MNAIRKNWKVIVGALVALFVVGVMVVYLSLGAIVKAGLVTVVPKITGTGFEIGGVSLAPLSGEMSITDVTLRNPEGFKSDSAVRVGKVFVSVDTASLFSDEVRVRSVRIESPRVTCEFGGSGTNLGTISDNVKKNMKGKEDGKPAAEKKEAKPGKRFVIDTLDIVGGKAELAATALGGTGAELAVADIHLKDIGKKGSGVDAEQLANEILTPLLNGAVTTLDSLGGSLKKQGDALLEKGAKDATKAAEDAVKGLFK